MHPSEEGEPPSSTHQGIEETEEAFTSLIAMNGAPRNRPSFNKIVKKLEDIPKISLPPTLPRRASISLAEHRLLGQFTRLWLLPKSVQKWVERYWNATT